MRLSLDAVEPELARLWKDEADRGGRAARRALHGRRARERARPARTRAAGRRRGRVRLPVAHDRRLLAAGRTTPRSPPRRRSTASPPGGAACGDAIVLEATGARATGCPRTSIASRSRSARVRLVGGRPPRLRPAVRPHGRQRRRRRRQLGRDGSARPREAVDDRACAPAAAARSATSMWIRLRPIQDLIARFFDDETAPRAAVRSIERITIEFAPREDEQDVASTQAGLLLRLDGERAVAAAPRRSPGSAGRAGPRPTLGRVVARFEAPPAADVPPGASCA